ncbi:MAG: Wzz/FepE/Etk N-terminal domain-containing protein [Anaerolineae bacterium]|nr:Wzz/FepE/Etk N-terminal domain-containing protein [Anaerolineae bacterium]
MEFRDYLEIIRKRGWIFIFLALFTAAVAVLVGKFQTPVYRATIVLRAEPARADWGLSNTAKDLLRSYTLQIRSHNTAQRAIERGQLDMSTDDLLSKITVSPDSSNFSIRIDAKDTDPKVAMTIAQKVAEIFAEDRAAWNEKQDKRDRIEVAIIDSARYELFSPKLKINAIVGFVVGLLLAGVIVFFLEWVQADLLRTPEQVERITGLVVLGSIPAGSEANPMRRRRLLPRIRPETLLYFGLGLIVGAVGFAVVSQIL